MRSNDTFRARYKRPDQYVEATANIFQREEFVELRLKNIDGKILRVWMGWQEARELSGDLLEQATTAMLSNYPPRTLGQTS